MSAGVVVAVGIWAASGPASATPSTTNAAPGADQQLLLAGGQRDRRRIGTAVAGMGSPSSSAPTVVVTEVCTNRPATPMIGPSPQGSLDGARVLRAASAAAIGAPSGPSTVTSARPGRLDLIETQCGAVDHVLPVQHADPHGVGDAGPQRHGLRTASSPAWSLRTCGPSPRSMATMVGCAGSAEELGVSRKPATSVGSGQRHRQRRRRSCAARRSAARSMRCAGHRRWPRTPSRARRSGRSRRGAGGSGLGDQVGQVRTLPRRAPTPSASPRSGPAPSACGSG